MKRYTALLRGISTSGKNKVPTAELEKGLEELDFSEVKTYLDNGNVVFSSDEDNIGMPVSQAETMINKKSGLDIPVFVTSKGKPGDILQNVPKWWGDEKKEIHDNLIFVMLPATSVEAWDEIGEPKEELERIKRYREAVFWSFS